MKSWFPHNSAWEEASQSKSVLFFVNFQKNNNTKQNKMRNSSRFRVRSTFRRPIGSAWRVPKKKKKFAKQHQQQQQQQRVGPILQKRERMRQHQSHRWFFLNIGFLFGCCTSSHWWENVYGARLFVSFLRSFLLLFLPSAMSWIFCVLLGKGKFRSAGKWAWLSICTRFASVQTVRPCFLFFIFVKLEINRILLYLSLFLCPSRGCRAPPPFSLWMQPVITIFIQYFRYPLMMYCCSFFFSLRACGCVCVCVCGNICARTCRYVASQIHTWS